MCECKRLVVLSLDNWELCACKLSIRVNFANWAFFFSRIVTGTFLYLFFFSDKTRFCYKWLHFAVVEAVVASLKQDITKNEQHWNWLEILQVFFKHISAFFLALRPRHVNSWSHFDQERANEIYIIFIPKKKNGHIFKFLIFFTYDIYIQFFFKDIW